MSGPIQTDPDPSYIADVVIVGGGIVGAILAKKLVREGMSVLVLEAGRATSIRPEAYEAYVKRFQMSPFKSPNSPYPDNPNAPAPSTTDIRRTPSAAGYFVSIGKLPFLTDYTRALGGTTLHFLGSCIRMLPHDFVMKTRYGVGEDWPITYDDLQCYYERAEIEIGVAADVDEQARHGTPFSAGYQFPMQAIPPTYLDRWLAANLRGLKVDVGAERVPIAVVGTPAGRNGMPNPKWRDGRGRGFHPHGMPYETRIGERCQGNSSCVPICPVMAKYNALRSLYSIDPPENRLRIITQAVASRIVLDKTRRRVDGVEYKRYDSEDSPRYTLFTAKGRIYVLAAHSIENAKLLLASDAANSSGHVGRNLMDHPYLVTWGLAPPRTQLGVYRGPQITSEIPVRDGDFRRGQAAFRGDIRNGGWDFARGSPYSDLRNMVDTEALFGDELRQQLLDRLQRQISFGFQVEQLPCADNRVEIRDEYRDQLGNHRPVISYDIDQYTRRGILTALDLNGRIFDHIRGADCTDADVDSPACLELESEPGRKKVLAVVKGSGHIMGTHRMGHDSRTSVVNRDLRSWDHDNLFVVGCGSMPTAGTSNPTLTAAALAFMAADRVLKDLQ